MHKGWRRSSFSQPGGESGAADPARPLSFSRFVHGAGLLAWAKLLDQSTLRALLRAPTSASSAFAMIRIFASNLPRLQSGSPCFSRAAVLASWHRRRDFWQASSIHGGPGAFPYSGEAAPGAAAWTGGESSRSCGGDVRGVRGVHPGSYPASCHNAHHGPPAKTARSGAEPSRANAPGRTGRVLRAEGLFLRLPQACRCRPPPPGGLPEF